MNENVVPVVGVLNHAEMKPHASLPDGRCWLYPTLTCEQHRINFLWALDAMLWFPMSPGHAILTPKVGAAPSRDEFVLVGDDTLPNEGTVDYWIELFRELQMKLGTAMTHSEYARQRDAFKQASEPELRRIADDRAAAFREDAKIAVEGESDAVVGNRVDEMMREGQFGRALEMVRLAKGTRAHRQRLSIERAAWHWLSQARMKVMDKDTAAAAELYKKVVDDFAGTEAAEVARKEMSQ